jgi:hypothetical protein
MHHLLLIHHDLLQELNPSKDFAQTVAGADQDHYGWNHSPFRCYLSATRLANMCKYSLVGSQSPVTGYRLNPGNRHNETSLFKEITMKQLSLKKNALTRKNKVAAGAVTSLVIAGLLSMAPISNAMARVVFNGNKTFYSTNYNTNVKKAEDFCKNEKKSTFVLYFFNLVKQTKYSQTYRVQCEKW